MHKSIADHEGRKYLRPLRGWSEDLTARQTVQTDVYCVLNAFGVTDPALAHCLKKLLCAGTRGKGSRLEDLTGALAALSRAIEDEEDAPEKRPS